MDAARFRQLKEKCAEMRALCEQQIATLDELEGLAALGELLGYMPSGQKIGVHVDPNRGSFATPDRTLAWIYVDGEKQVEVKLIELPSRYWPDGMETRWRAKQRAAQARKERQLRGGPW